MVDHDTIPFKIEEACEENRAIVHGGDWGSGVDAEVEAEVRALGNTVEDSLGAEDIGGRCIYGSSEVALPFEFGRDATEVVLFNLYTFGDLSLLLRIGLSEFLFDCELNFDFGILRAADYKCVLESLLSL